MDELTARRLLLVRAFDSAKGSPLWTAEDSAWASRLAAQTAPANAPPQRFLAERATHALLRIEPRDQQATRWLARSGWRWYWLLPAAFIGLIFGLGTDLLAGRAIIDILAPSVWAIILWNFIVYLGLLVSIVKSDGADTGLLRRGLLAWWRRDPVKGPIAEATRQWLPLAQPVAMAQAASLLHVAAAAFAAGLVAGMYARGLVFDFRAGWQSTFLDTATVQRTLSALLAPASAFSGIKVPDIVAIEAMRLTPVAPQATASAAPWIHLYATLLGLLVIAPRSILAMVATVQSLWRAKHIELPLQDAYFQQLLRQRRGGPASVIVFPHAAAPDNKGFLTLRNLLAREYGDDVQITLSDVVRLGDEEQAGRATTAELQLVWVQLGATPEAESHGRLLQALRKAAPGAALVLIGDESDFARRFAAVPSRLVERRSAWKQLADSNGVGFLSLDSAHCDTAQADAALKQAFSR